MRSNWRHRSNHCDDDDAKYVGERDDDLESCCSVQTQAFIPKQTKRHRYNKYNDYNRRHNNHQSNMRYPKPQRQQIMIKPFWKPIEYDASDKHKIGQCIKYGQYCKFESTLTEYLIFYGTRILHMNIYGDVIGYYEAGMWSWGTWFWYFMGGNTVFDLNVFSRIDLFGSSVICGRDLVNDSATSYEYIECICKKGWLEGLKHVIETLHINPIDNRFDLLVHTVYRFNSDVFRYLLSENNDFYEYFDIDQKKNEYGETLWSCCRKQLQNIITPGSGWLHCLECLHYAPYLIYELHQNDNDNYIENEDEIEGNVEDAANWMVHELNDIDLKIETTEIPSQFVQQRLNIISNIMNHKPETFKLESCFYGLCADAAGAKPHCVHFWKPHAYKRLKRHQTDSHLFEYVPCDTDDDEHWGRLKMTVSARLNKINIPYGCWLTVVPHRNNVKLCQFRTDDTQLWRIKQIKLQNGDNIWIQIINKLGYKLILSWNPTTYALSSSMPLLSVSNKVNGIDPLCADLFSVARNNFETRYAFYLNKNKQKNHGDILAGIGTTLNRNSFWRLSVDGAQFHLTKYHCYKNRVRDIAQILWQFKQRYEEKMEN